MLGAIAARVGEAWAVTASLQLVLWLIQQRTRNAGTVDVGWALSFSLIVALFAARATAPASQWAVLALLAVAWSVRLGAHLIVRGAASSPEEGRYADLRARWGAAASRRFAVFFQAQALLAAVLSTALVVPFIGTPWDSGWLRALGLAIVAIAVVGEATADHQLTRWKRDPANRKRPCETGLWRYSRHPNYFFEWLFWVGLAVVGAAFAPWGLIALGAPAFMLITILFVTGIPPTEKQSIASKGDAYRDYQRRVSKFVPWPPKSS